MDPCALPVPAEAPHLAWWASLPEPARDALIRALHGTETALRTRLREEEEEARVREAKAREATRDEGAGDGGAEAEAEAEAEAHATQVKSETREEVFAMLRAIVAGDGEGWRDRFLALHQEGMARAREREAAEREARAECDRLRTECGALRAELEGRREEAQADELVEANSSRRGRKYEEAMEDAVRAAFPGAVYENCARAPHSGDATLLAPNYGPYKCMLEFKSHARSVGDGDVAKLARDLDAGDCAFAVMATRTANVARRRDFSVERTPGGKPVLFLVRTDECPGAVGPLLKVALRCLGRLVDDDGDGETTHDAERAVQQYTRVSAGVKRQLTTFGRQWETLRDTLLASLDEWGESVAPEISAARIRRALERCRTEATGAAVPLGFLLEMLRNHHPGLTKRRLGKILRSHKGVCRVSTLKPGTPRWDALRGGGDWWALKNGAKTVCVVEAVPPLPPVAVGEPGLATKTAL